MSKLSVCVCGGGNIGHAIAAYAAYQSYKVSIYSRNPEKWARNLSATLPDGREITATIFKVSEKPSIVIGADIIFITVPKFGVAEILERISPFLESGQALVAVPAGAGFDWMTHSLLSRGIDILGLQRVPFISRTVRYGKEVRIQGFKKILKMAALPNTLYRKYYNFIEQVFGTPVEELKSFLSITLNNSNPLLHPARLYTLFSDWKDGVVYNRNPLFYEEWDDRASDALIHADEELTRICERIPQIKDDVVPICTYYEVSSIEEMTAKIRSITAFRGIHAPMKMEKQGFIPDFTSRYFLEDIPYGTIPIKAIAELAEVKTLVIDSFIEWAQQHSRKIVIKNGFLLDDKLIGLPVPKNYGLNTFSSLLSNSTH